MQSKISTIECMEVCATRKRYELGCNDCKFKGEACVTAHEYARYAVLIASQKEVVEYAERANGSN